MGRCSENGGRPVPLGACGCCAAGKPPWDIAAFPAGVEFAAPVSAPGWTVFAAGDTPLLPAVRTMPLLLRGPAAASCRVRTG